MKNFILKYKLTIVCVILVLIAILMPGDDVPSVGVPNMDKAVHFTMFFVTSSCLFLESSSCYRSASYGKILIARIAGLIVFAYATEIMQLFVPGRSYDLTDLLADSIGVVLAVGAYFGLVKWRNKK